ncbi:MAG TPA: tetratricopeptide repeat protein, partial [Candidatus Eisenbacteria bacterium]|nr:tetratricopeptide repeat protein [Candidatus Eisenbacteria bacterium]
AAGPQYHFDHSKIREILYDSIPPELRIEYHTVVGQFLAESFGASEEHAGIIAHNLIAAGLKEDALPFLNRAAAAAAKLFAHSDAIRHLERAESLLHDLYPQSPPVERVRELSEIRQRRGDHEYAAGRYRAALASYETALVLRQSAPDPTREAELTRAIGRVQYLLGHAAESQHAYEEAIARYATIVQEARASGDDERLNEALRELGKLYFFRGNLEESERLLREAIELAERRGDDRLRAAAINNLTGIPFVRGDLEQAMAGHRVCLGIRERTKDDLGLAQTHKNIGILHYRMGEIEEGERHLEEALAGYRKAGDRRGESVTLRHLGNLLHYRGDQAGARRHWEASLYLCRELGNNEDLCSCLNNLGLLHFEQGHYASAERLYREALEIRSSLNPNDHSMAIYHDNLAELYIDLHQLGRAEEELRLADQLAGALDAAPILTEVLAKRARIASQRGEHEQGRDFARAALSVAEPTGQVESLVEALLALAEVELGAGRFGESKRAARQGRDVAHWSRMPHFELRAALVASRAAWMEGGALEPLAELRAFVERAEAREYKALAAQLRHLMGEIHARSSEWDEAAADLTRAAEDMKEILLSLTEEDRRSLVHHPDWRSLIGALLDTLIHVGRRDEAISYLAALGMGTCEVAEPSTAEAQTVS